jgi:undecaprenyl-diphosphatase
MQIVQAVLLGLLQGLTEFIPVSSSGHLVLAEKLFNIQFGSLLFDVSLHIGTLLALLIYFANDLFYMGQDFLKIKGSRLGWYIVLATIPAVIVGMLLQDLASSSFRSIWLVCFNLVLVALVMLAADRTPQAKDIKQLKLKNALAVGAAQTLALVPGVSRSGISIVAARLQGFKREAAARFSFLLAIPVTLGAVLVEVAGGIHEISASPDVFIAGIVSAAISGLVAIHFMLRFLRTRGLAIFAYYRIGLAVIIVAALLVK